MDPSLPSYIIGQCTDMCPANEIHRREQEGLLHRFETLQSGRQRADPHKVVKCYVRSAAGHQSRPEDVRTPCTLLRTTLYLITEVMAQYEDQFHAVFSFVFDRLRAVRQDLVVQGVRAPESRAILEICTRFHVYSGYRLAGRPVDVFDPVLNNEHIRECVSRLLSLYDEEQTTDAARGQMEALYMLGNLGLRKPMDRALGLPRAIRQSRVMSTAMKLSLAWDHGNYVRVVRMIQRLPFLLQCVLVPHVQLIRRRALEVMNVAFSSKNCNYQLCKLTTLLAFDDDVETEKCCRHYGLSLTENHVAFLKGSFKNDVKLMTSAQYGFMNHNHINSDPVRLVLGRTYNVDR